MAIEYTNYIYAEEEDLHSHNDCPGYNTKQSDGKAPLMLEFWEYPFIAIAPGSTLAQSGFYLWVK